MTTRWLPDEPLPPYSFVPGLYPHPFSDPAGHSFGQAAPQPMLPDAEGWAENQVYLRGLDLFNHGYYWEAHEAWEALWQACGRRGNLADFLKALIQLAAAGVKVREGKPVGVRGHAERATQLLAGLPDKKLMGLEVAEVRRQALTVMQTPPISNGAAAVEIVFAFQLTATR